ncbi:cAMP-binding domain of CRP or a regulatory subunit of cAMP-dependent protein kinases [Lutibacter agarilyticus]|uniref:cAMP-binding domain of CRP or a regulatory subunit of cAMP-dependent protein kinases n=1 Tax=Lutibacter agarilyticus TaxID=1109740 RepID=A0A238VTX7_9FLAO|nr:Crp/Fnr family transcriptional regulator [Lutibacter agarilyticus]SNR37607.1 cAMP-binding domain of CRP or a regulatory subunit of cAMP-dependent protein kinases [Lutibacter agarilyticus]
MLEIKAAPLLKYIKKYISLTNEEEAFLLSKLNYRKYLKGQYVVQQGDVCKQINFLISGCTKTFFLDDKGQEHIVLFAIEDWWTSDIGSYITQSGSDFNVQCIEDTEVIQFQYDYEEELYKEIPKLERLFRKMLEKALVSSQKRIVGNFSLSAKEQYLQFKKQYPTIEQRVPQYMVASYLGITKEFLSKIKSQLALES